MEDMVYDPDTGQLLSGSLMDYAMPRADDFCDFAIRNNPVPTPTNPLGVKGGKEIKSWQTAWRGAKRRAGIKEMRWHDLRHTAGTRKVRAGADISTTRRYVSRDMDSKRKAMELLSESRTIPEVRVGREAK